MVFFFRLKKWKWLFLHQLWDHLCVKKENAVVASLFYDIILFFDGIWLVRWAHNNFNMNIFFLLMVIVIYNAVNLCNCTLYVTARSRKVNVLINLGKKGGFGNLEKVQKSQRPHKFHCRIHRDRMRMRMRMRCTEKQKTHISLSISYLFSFHSQIQLIQKNNNLKNTSQLSQLLIDK